MRLLDGEGATRELGGRAAQYCRPPLVIYLSGELGSGKTTFARGFLRALGYTGNVKSPTFSLLETYELEDVNLYHFDLYRIRDAHELEYTGIRDLSTEANAVSLVEWPQRGEGAIPAADLVFEFQHHGDQRTVKYHAESDNGKVMVARLQACFDVEGGRGKVS